jgi:hypothetical protein
MDSLAEAVTAIEDLKNRRLIEDYAVGGAMAQVFWAEAIPTFDLDVLVLIADTGSLLVDLGPFYEWATERGYEVSSEHIVIAGMPVQLMPAPTELSQAAVRAAKTLDYNGLPIRVVSPEYLICLWLEGSAKTVRRKERAYALRETGVVDEQLLRELMERYKLTW